VTIAVIIFLLVGTLLAPTVVLGGGFREWTCTGNVIEAFEKSGQYLAEVIPSQSLVYWDGENAQQYYCMYLISGFFRNNSTGIGIILRLAILTSLHSIAFRTRNWPAVGKKMPMCFCFRKKYT
jgi:hypothetical protein